VSLLCIGKNAFTQDWKPDHAVGTLDGKYSFPYTQTPTQLVELFPAADPNTGLSYQWESSTSPLFLNPTTIGIQSSYSFSGPLTQTTYFRRKTTASNGSFIYSNTFKISLVSENWEDLNYVREHDITVSGVTTWQQADQLPIGQKFQTTTYLDGLGRSVQKVSRETATPSNSNNLWGDVVQFSVYDNYGTQSESYLPYTTTSQSGKYKTTPATEQGQYYLANYNEAAVYSRTVVSFDGSPLNRVKTIKEPGEKWAQSAGKRVSYDMNDAAEDVKIFRADYAKNIPPSIFGSYGENDLYKVIYTDENNAKVIEYTNHIGQLVLKKVQLDDVPSAAHSGWICTYFVYDDFGRLRYQLQPEAVKYLDNNSWSFAGTNGTQVLKELCFQYFYDEKGRMVWKKAPGAEPLSMIYDSRDRVVFTQDGNQAAQSPAEWTAILYDELDRPIITTLYHTTKTIAQLQSDIDNATTSTASIANPSQAITDLVVDARDQSITRYAAQNSIDFVSNGDVGFESVTNDEFVAEIDAAAVTAGYSTAVSTMGSPVSSADLNNPSVCTIIKYQFYDDYNFSGVKSFDNAFNNTTAYSNSVTDIIPIEKSKRTLSFPTGSMTRVLGSNTFLSSTTYYDEKGRPIQNLEDNLKSGVDVATIQYHFDGRVMSTDTKHTAVGTGFSNYSILSKYLFDKAGRVTSIQKKFGTNAFKTISTYDYDDVGRVKTKHLDPGYTANGGSELESLTYSFNIHNQITGINKDYALKTGSYSRWNHFFGMYLGFDNKDGLFTKQQLNGQVTGIIWNTQGDDVERKYNYTYDNAGRLINADYKEQFTPGDVWSNTVMDFSVSGYTGKITYDLNGNLVSMSHKGVLPGIAPITVDDLRYSYTSPSLTYTNKLQSVTDQMSNTDKNGLFGDFKRGNTTTNPDYVYDANGNVVIDLNKNAKELNSQVGSNGIHYNFLDKPDEIRIAGKGTIKIVYSGDGEKLQRIFTPETGVATTTTYINQFVYQSSGNSGDQLSYIQFEEGRIRAVTPTSQNSGYDLLTVDGNMDLPDGRRGAYDYFILDYQQNVRMILTEETHVASGTATMEPSRASDEDAVFGQPGSSNEVETTRYATPPGWTANSSSNVSRLGNIAGRLIGPNTFQKVMAGDIVNTNVNYYFNQSPGSTSNSMFSAVVSSLVKALSAGPATSLVKGSIPNINNQLNGDGGVVYFTSSPGGINPSAPVAFLNIMFFDERFRFVDYDRRQVDASVSGNGASLTIAGYKVPRNGYVYVFVSNKSDGDVYFDDFKVTVAQGNIIEENHYYSFGLKIAAISSKKFADSYDGNINNPFLYNGKEMLDDDADLNWYDYGFRSYDPQIGRFMQLDPLTDSYPFLTPYQFAGNDPIANVDLDGLEPERVIEYGGELIGDYGAKGLTNVIISAGKQAAKSGFWKGAGRFLKGFWNGTKELGSFAINIFNPDPEKNTLVQTGKFLYNTVTDPIGTFKNIKTAVQNIDWSDPATYGEALSMFVVPGAALKSVKYLSKAAKFSKITKLRVFKGSVKGEKILSETEKAVQGEKVASELKQMEEITQKLENKTARDMAPEGEGNGMTNRFHHVFDKPEHNLDDLVAKFGSEQSAFEAVQGAANTALKEGKLTPNKDGILPSGDNGNIIDVGGMKVRLIGGKVEGGKVTISSFSRKGL
jgi:RHS repeat-associated protein